MSQGVSKVSMMGSVRSNVALNHLAELKEEYCILEDYELYVPKGYRGNSVLVDKHMVIYEDSLRAGLRFPLHPFIVLFLTTYGVCMS